MVEENSNAPFSFGAMQRYFGEEVAKEYWLNEVYPDHISDAHRRGDFHIHDLGGLTLYCCGYSLKQIIQKGVTGVPNIPRSKPAKHFASIINHIVNLATIFQNEIKGAVAFNSVDTLLAPFVNFNPRSPCGERRLCPCLPWMGREFQSTLPVRGATVM